MTNSFDNFEHFSALTGVGIQVVALDGTPVCETEHYLAFKKTLTWLDYRIIGGLEEQTKAAIISGAMQSYRFGGRFFFYSPIGFFHFASPIIRNGRHTLTAVGGPVLMIPLEDFIPFDLEGKLTSGYDRDELIDQLQTVPIISPNMANTLSEQLLVNAKHASDAEYLGINSGDSRLGEYMLAYFSGKPSYEEILKLAAEQKREKASKKHERIIAAVNDYIQQNYMKKITLEGVAKSIYMSPTYLSKVIKNQTGKSFRHLVNMVRIGQAVLLIENTDKKLAEIAFQTGFGDHSYFTKVFKRHTKTNPNDYRRKNR